VRRSILLFLVPLAIAGCGGSSSDSGSGGGGGGSTSTASDGKGLFAGKCGSCHTLKAAGTNGSFGPNLDQLKPSKAVVLATIKKGPGPMPAGLYTGADADKVATFVSENAGQ
jgi:mono/diheme cytochrome c family protein